MFHTFIAVPIQDQDREALYDNAAPDQDARSLKQDLATELIYDNNRLIDSSKIEVLGGDSDEFEVNPVYGAPEDTLITSEMVFKSNGQLAEPRKLTSSTGSSYLSLHVLISTIFIVYCLIQGFDDQAVYGEGLMMDHDTTPATCRMLPASSLPFFHGLISRKKCEILLKEEGDFLMRESESRRGQYVISGLYQGKCQHLLFMAEDGKVHYFEIVDLFPQF